MTPREKGRFCDSCQKEVMDFTRSSHDEIYDTYNAHNGNVCGHFLPQQMGVFRPTPIAARRQLGFMRRFFMAVLIVFGSALFLIPNDALAQHLTNLKTTSETVNARGENDANAISGKVVDYDGEGLVLASVMLKHNDQLVAAATSNLGGEFRLVVPKNKLAVLDELHIKVTLAEHTEARVNHVVLDGKEIEVMLWPEELDVPPLDGMMMMGEPWMDPEEE